MIIFAKADGTVVETNPTPFYQGSSLKGSIYLVAPFPNTNGVTIQFQLPNGNITKAYPMTPTGEVEGVMLDGYEVSAWTWDVKNAMVTAIPGVVTATIKVIDTDDNVISIVSSFSVIKGTPNALDPSTPSASEWQAIISALGSIGGKVTMPLMTNFEYNPTTGESEKTYNNGMVQTQTFPAINKNGFVEYQSFTRSTFDNNWETSNRTGYSKMLIISESTIGSASGDFDIAIFKGDEDSSEKMNPLIVVDKDSSSIGIYSNEAYAGYALFFWKGSFVEQNYLPSIEKAKLDAEVATSQAEIATERANSISQTLEDAYENGELGIPSGGTEGQFLKKTENGTAWQDFLPNVTQNANKTIIVDGSVVNGNWNATFIVQQGGKERPISTQHTNHTGAKAEMVATANSAKVKFVNGSTDPQSYMEIFENRINFSKPITVQDNPVGGGGISYMSLMESTGINWDDASDYNGYFLIPKGYTSYTFYNSDGEVSFSNEDLTISGTKSFSYNRIHGLKILTNPYYDETGLLQDFYAVRGWNFMGNAYESGMNGTILKMK